MAISWHWFLHENEEYVTFEIACNFIFFSTWFTFLAIFHWILAQIIKFFVVHKLQMLEMSKTYAFFLSHIFHIHISLAQIRCYLLVPKELINTTTMLVQKLGDKVQWVQFLFYTHTNTHTHTHTHMYTYKHTVCCVWCFASAPLSNH